LEYKTRHRLYMEFLVAVIKHIRPDVICPMTAQKLLQPDLTVKVWEMGYVTNLVALINVRMFNITNSQEKYMVMDTVGLHALGLPDLQIRFADQDPDDVGALLYNFADYIFDNGDVIKDGNTIDGAVKGSRWECMHEPSLIQPSRWVINITQQ